jgi:hypothetical protein
MMNALMAGSGDRKGRLTLSEVWHFYLSPGSHINSSLLYNKSSFTIGILVSGKHKKAFPLRLISLGRPVHNFPIKKSDF